MLVWFMMSLNNQATRNSSSEVSLFVLDTVISEKHEEFTGLINPTACHYNAVDARALADNIGHECQILKESIIVIDIK